MTNIDQKDVRIQELEQLIINLTEPNLTYWINIQGETGLPEDQCKYMEFIINDIINKRIKND